MVQLLLKVVQEVLRILVLLHPAFQLFIGDGEDMAERPDGQKVVLLLVFNATDTE